MKAWLRGGIIGAIFGLLESVLLILFNLLDSTLFTLKVPIISMITYIFILPIWPLIMLFSVRGSAPLIISFSIVIILSTIFYFIIGSLIGFIVGKIKQRNIKDG